MSIFLWKNIGLKTIEKPIGMDSVQYWNSFTIIFPIVFIASPIIFFHKGWIFCLYIISVYT